MTKKLSPEESEKIMDKIRKLIAMQTSSNPNEVANATGLIKKLLDQYNFSIDQITLIKDKKVGVEEQKIKARGYKRDEWEIELFVAVGKFFDCKTILVGDTTYAYIGVRTDIDCANQMITKIREQIYQAALLSSHQYPGYDNQWKRKRWIRDYCYGCTHTITKRLEVLKDLKTPQTTALVIAKDALIDEWMKEMYPDLGSRQSRDRDIDYNAMYAGSIKGKRIRLTEEVEGK